jgi:hypothetical protein
LANGLFVTGGVLAPPRRKRSAWEASATKSLFTVPNERGLGRWRAGAPTYWRRRDAIGRCGCCHDGNAARIYLVATVPDAAQAAAAVHQIGATEIGLGARARVCGFVHRAVGIGREGASATAQRATAARRPAGAPAADARRPTGARAARARAARAHSAGARTATR